jgi:hypothetical protein
MLGHNSCDRFFSSLFFHSSRNHSDMSFSFYASNVVGTEILANPPTEYMLLILSISTEPESLGPAPLPLLSAS